MIPAKWAAVGASLGPLFMVVQACSGGGSGGATHSDAGSGQDSGGSAYPPTLTAIYNDTLTLRCALPFCHLGIAAPVMPLSSKDAAYQQLVNVPASGMYCGQPPVGPPMVRVVPGHPETSLLYLKVENPAPATLCGGTMPGAGRGGPLDANQIKQIQEWIMLGAKND